LEPSSEQYEREVETTTAPLTDEYVGHFMLGGNATFTVTSKKTGTRFTYRVEANKERTRYFVSLLTGSDNESDYAYLGTIFAAKPLKDCQGPRDAVSRYYHGKKSRISESASGARAFAWFANRVLRNLPVEEAEVHHCGRCGRCGRKLTVPESIETGFGPECLEKIAMGA
jgi:hypothetical protein